MIKKIFICLSLVLLLSLCFVGSVFADDTECYTPSPQSLLNSILAYDSSIDITLADCQKIVSTRSGNYYELFFSASNLRIWQTTATPQYRISVLGVSPAPLFFIRFEIDTLRVINFGEMISHSPVINISKIVVNHDVPISYLDGTGSVFTPPPFTIMGVSKKPLGNLMKDFGGTSQTLSVVGVLILSMLLAVFLIPRLVRYFL